MTTNQRLLVMSALLVAFAFSMPVGLYAKEQQPWDMGDGIDPEQLAAAKGQTGDPEEDDGEEEVEEDIGELQKPASQWPKGNYFLIGPHSKQGEEGSNRPHGFQLGPTGLCGEPYGRNLWITYIIAGSPADGKVMPADIVYGVNGKDFPEVGKDVRYYFANAITEAETREAGGKLVLHIRRKGELIEVPIQLQVMGSYSSTTPWNCEKSKNIALRAEEYMLKRLRPEKGLPQAGSCVFDPFYDGLLFLMATGDPKVQGLVRRQIKDISEEIKRGTLPGNQGWTYCYIKMIFGEYYHLTGDPSVLPLLEKMSKKAGWSPPTGKNTYGLHPHMQMPDTMGALLAYEAGLDVNKEKLWFDLKYLNDKRAEYGYVKYKGYGAMTVEDRQIDAPEEITEKAKANGTYSSMNGKLGTAAALFSMVDGYEKTMEACATRCAYSYSRTQRGHGGVWFNGFWSPIGALHAGPEKAQLFMKGQQWWRELFRHHSGAMWETGNAKGKDDALGTGFAIHWVMHRKRLRMFGAPRSYFCANPPPYLQPALAAHRNRDYALAEKLIRQLLESGQVPAQDKDRTNHFLESIRILKESIELDLTFTEALIQKGNYALANHELGQLEMVVSPDNPRLKAIASALQSSAAPAHVASNTAAKKGPPPKQADGSKGERMARFMADYNSIVNLTKDAKEHEGIRLGRREGDLDYAKYPWDELTKWRMIKGQDVLANPPAGWEKPDFDDSKWKETVELLPRRRKTETDKDVVGGLLYRTSFEIDDVNAFKTLRLRMIAAGMYDLSIYLNGTLVAKGGQLRSYTCDLGPTALACLRKGKNTFAFSVYRGEVKNITRHSAKEATFSFRLEGLAKNAAYALKKKELEKKAIEAKKNTADLTKKKSSEKKN
jgi:Family of unknown function (DUF6288)